MDPSIHFLKKKHHKFQEEIASLEEKLSSTQKEQRVIQSLLLEYEQEMSGKGAAISTDGLSDKRRRRAWFSSRVYEYIREHGPISAPSIRDALTKEFGYKAQMVHVPISRMLAGNKIEISEKTEERNGKKIKLYQITRSN